MKREKLYKFNMQKYGHNIEYAYNIARNKVDSDSATDQDWENYEHVSHVYQQILCNSDGRYAYLPYKIWQEATEVSIWADIQRGGF